jgi:hypothetical protein
MRGDLASLHIYPYIPHDGAVYCHARSVIFHIDNLNFACRCVRLDGGDVHAGEEACER